MSNATFSFGSLSILKPDGTVLGNNRLIGPGSTFFDTATLPSAGTYTVVIDPNGDSTGSATLQVYDVPPDAGGPISPGGPPVTLATSVPGQNGRLTFAGTAGQRVSLSISKSTYGSATAKILDAGGNTVGGNVLFGTGAGFVDVRTLPSTGTYAIAVDPPDTTTGSATFTLYDVPPDPAGTIALGSSFVTNIVASGQNAAYTFNGTAGQRISLKIGPSTISMGYVAGIDPERSERWATSHVGEDIVRRTIAAREPLYTIDYLGDPRFTPDAHGAAVANEIGLRAIAIAPLVSERGALGTLAVFSSLPGSFGPNEANLLGALADQAAIAMLNARLIDDLERSQLELAARAETERSLRDIAARITSLGDPGELLARVVEESRRLLGSEGAHLTRMSDDGTSGDDNESGTSGDDNGRVQRGGRAPAPADPRPAGAGRAPGQRPGRPARPRPAPGLQAPARVARGRPGARPRRGPPAAVSAEPRAAAPDPRLAEPVRADVERPLRPDGRSPGRPFRGEFR